MSLTPVTRLGPHDIVAPLGAGGMGEGYRARDTRLGRDVAVKVPPTHLSAEAEMRARFEREAKTISTLNHPSICTLFDVGPERETDYLVMELVEGETLAERLRRGALPPAEVSLASGALEAGQFHPLFQLHGTGGYPRYDVSPDVSRFPVTVPPEGGGDPPITIATNWTAKRRSR